VAEYKILIKHKSGIFDAESKSIKRDISDLGVKKNVSVETAQIYDISGDVSLGEINKISQNLLIDPLTQMVFINSNPENESISIEVYYKSGVTDSVADTIKIGISDMNINKKLFIKTGKKYFLKGNLTIQEIKKIAEKILSNAVVQEYRLTD
jgi:phosphoribosylformylglycinamidine (FGAM) synthase PurS component